MRKRLVIGAIAAVVIGVAGYMFSQPRQGTVQWHKRGYLNSFERLNQNTWKQKLQRVYCRLAGRAVPREDYRTIYKAFDYHLTSLIRLGYLQRARVSLTNATEMNAMKAGYRGRDADDAIRNFVSISPEAPQVVHIIAPCSVLPTVEAAIRKADVAETR